MKDPNFLICPKGHTIRIDGENLTLNEEKDYGSTDFEGNPCKGFGLPCPACCVIYWEDLGGGSRELSALEFVVCARILGMQVAKGQVQFGYVTGMLSMLDHTAARIIERSIEEEKKRGN